LTTIPSPFGLASTFQVTQDVHSDELLDLLLEHHPEKWNYIRHVMMSDPVVFSVSSKFIWPFFPKFSKFDKPYSPKFSKYRSFETRQT